MLFHPFIETAQLLYEEHSFVVESALASANVMRGSKPACKEDGSLEQWKEFPNRNMEVVFRLAERESVLSVSVRVFHPTSRTCICTIGLRGRLRTMRGDTRRYRYVQWGMDVKRRSPPIPDEIERLIKRMSLPERRGPKSRSDVKLQLEILFRYIRYGAKSL